MGLRKIEFVVGCLRNLIGSREFVTGTLISDLSLVAMLVKYSLNLSAIAFAEVTKLPLQSRILSIVIFFLFAV